MQQRTLLVAALLLATVCGAFSQTFDDAAFLSGDYGFEGGYYGGSYLPTYVDDAPAYYPGEYQSATPQYFYGYSEPTAPTYAPAYYTYSYVAPTPGAYGVYEAPATPAYYYYSSAVEPTFPAYYSYSAPAYYAPTFSYGSYDAPAYSYAPTYSYSYAYAAPAFYYTPTPAASPAPGTCPPCPTCSATTRSYASAAATIAPPAPAGTCYCPYDADWKTWAVADPACRTALYSKCQTDSRLPCSWLDQYFSATSATPTAGYTRPNEPQIFAYLYSDCAPAPPCACAPLTFTAADAPSQVYTCCRQLQTYAQIPFSGLSQSVTDAFCSSGQRASEAKAWVEHALWSATCPAASTTSPAVFTTPSPSTSTTVTASSTPATGTPSGSIKTAAETSAVQSAADRRARRRRAAVATAAAATGGAVGGALFAAAVTLVVLHLRRPRHEGTYHAVV